MPPSTHVTFATPIKAVVFYLQGLSRVVSTGAEAEADTFPETPLSVTNHQALDEMCQRGCCGTVALEAEEGLQGDGTVSEFMQILGLSGCKDTDEMSLQLKRRFGKISFGLITTSDILYAVSTSLSFVHTELLSTATTPTALAHLIHTLVPLDSFKTTNPVAPQPPTPHIDVLFVHLSLSTSADLDACSNLIHVLDSTIADVLDTTPHLLKIVLISWAKEAESARARKHYDPVEAEIDDHAKLLRPRQSYKMRDGDEVVIDITRTPLSALYYHHGSTRCDTAARFTEREVLERGGNGRILAWQFLAEIGYKLGFVPKYGA